jgi:glycosyltransferase involved in cell wall biosynthesis
MASSALEVLHVTEVLGHGGAEQNLLTFLRRLPRAGFRHHLAWLYEDERLVDAFRPHVVSMVPLHAGRNLGLLAAAARLARFIRHTQPDVVHAQLTRSMLVARMATAMTNTPLVSTWQSVHYDQRALADFGNSRLRKGIVRWLDEQTGRRERRFIAVSSYVAQQNAAQLSVEPQRVTVVYNAVDPDRFAPVDAATLAATRSKLGLDGDGPLLLTVGRLVPGKAQRETIAAMPAVVKKYPRAKLLLAGQGPMRAELERVADELGVKDSVLLLGPRSDVAALYQMADLFVFPTHYEGLSVALLEALSNGLCAAVSDIPQNREVADGLPSVSFFPVRDVSGQTECILEALADLSDRKPHAMAARVPLSQRFHPDRMATRFGEVLHEVAGR